MDKANKIDWGITQGRDYVKGSQGEDKATAMAIKDSNKNIRISKLVASNEALLEACREVLEYIRNSNDDNDEIRAVYSTLNEAINQASK
jgi:hypothetical protein